MDSKTSELSEIAICEIHDPSDIDSIPDEISFFARYIEYWIKEVLEINGQVYTSTATDATISGIFLYDTYEKYGSVYTRSSEVFHAFYSLKPFKYLYAEFDDINEKNKEIYDIFKIDFHDHPIDHRFNHEITSAESKDIPDLERFMVLAQPDINPKWIQVALDSGEKCFMVKLAGEITGVGWTSLVNRIGRLHSFFVQPRFRKLGIGQDILFARLLWLKSKGAQWAFSEISRNNIPSSKVSLKGRMRVAGQVYQYFKK